jgi:hypothetical protein
MTSSSPAKAIVDLIEGVTEKWAKQRKAEERDASARLRRDDRLVYYVRPVSEVRQCPVVYIAAEGAGGIKKRIAGLKKVAAEKGLPIDIPFYLITVAPKLGAGDGDCKKLIADIEAQLPGGLQPGAITVDTTQQSLGGADENGTGMDMLVVNCTAIINAFPCLVILVHHSPVSDDERLRGKGSLGGGLDASIIIKREKGSMVAALIVKKMRDEDDGQAFTVNLARVVLGKTKKGREVSTLVVETVDPGATEVSAVNALSALRYALDEVGAIPPASNHIPAGQKCVSVSQWREYAYAVREEYAARVLFARTGVRANPAWLHASHKKRQVLGRHAREALYDRYQRAKLGRHYRFP